MPRISSLTSPPSSSPLKQRAANSHNDRFIPSRGSSLLDKKYSIAIPSAASQNQQQPIRENDNDNTTNNAEKEAKSPTMLDLLLRTELLGVESPVCSPRSPAGVTRSGQTSRKPQNVFQFKSTPTQRPDKDKVFFGLSSPCPLENVDSSPTKTYSPSQIPRRRIQKTPFKLLDAPNLQDDFYLNLVDWSKSNILAVGLANSVYLWSFCTNNVTKLVSYTDKMVTSVHWAEYGDFLAVGTSQGLIEIYDITTQEVVTQFSVHQVRVGSLDWQSNLVCSGSRDRTICLFDVRSPTSRDNSLVGKLIGHKQEVCGLKWGYTGYMLASGGNDNKLLIWDVRQLQSSARNGVNCHSNTTEPVLNFDSHIAAVKAIAWSPHQNGLLASGGGTADRCIKFWNTTTGTLINSMDTGSQVCNLMWSKTVNELVSTHGYSLNQIIVWQYPTLHKVATLTGHTCRVLYISMSPDGQTIVTGAGDETLRFWNVFPSNDSERNKKSGFVLSLGGNCIR